MKILNKRARFEYQILNSIEAGIVLTGPEVKSIRSGRADLTESFARLQNGQAFLKNAYIFPYQGAAYGYDPRKDRKLLLHRKQIDQLQGQLSKAGVTLIPLSFYTTRNMIKVELALAQAKKKFDKRKALKAKDEERKIEQELNQ